MQRLQPFVFLVSAGLFLVGLFGVPGDWKTMTDLLAQVQNNINSHAAYPTFVFMGIGLFLGGNVIPLGVWWLLEHFHNKPLTAEFHKQFDEIADQRAYICTFASQKYNFARSEDSPRNVTAFVARAEIPSALPLEEHGSLVGWPQSIGAYELDREAFNLYGFAMEF